MKGGLARLHVTMVMEVLHATAGSLPIKILSIAVSSGDVSLTFVHDCMHACACGLLTLASSVLPTPVGAQEHEASDGTVRV